MPGSGTRPGSSRAARGDGGARDRRARSPTGSATSWRGTCTGRRLRAAGGRGGGGAGGRRRADRAALFLGRADPDPRSERQGRDLRAEPDPHAGTSLPRRARGDRLRHGPCARGLRRGRRCAAPAAGGRRRRGRTRSGRRRRRISASSTRRSAAPASAPATATLSSPRSPSATLRATTSPHGTPRPHRIVARPTAARRRQLKLFKRLYAQTRDLMAALPVPEDA